MKNKNYFPMFIDLTDKNVLVVGGGKIAYRRILALLQFTRNINVVSAQTGPEIQELSKLGQIRLQMRNVKRSDLADAYLVIAATMDHKLNDDIYRACKEQGIYVNVFSDKEKCDFYFPGVYVQDDITIGITVNGLDQEKAKRISTAIKQALKTAMEE